MQIVLYEPEIPPNTGTIARLCAATTTRLNLIEPLGFSLEDRYLKRAGLDYWPHVDKKIWPSWTAFLDSRPTGRLICTSARRGLSYHRFVFRPDDLIVLGPETRGLPAEVLDQAEHVARLPIWGQVRSVNLANAAAVLLYEAYRQTGELDRREVAE
ncbi:MAG: tRNA (cytidine(34)-2'-O)-methyltransferase [Deltaproteobacteria bacterium]|nr:tRNA (cytidine(34)-2'-O)-methyltransferase [Deltaproteobacteria bacterium]